MQWFNSRNALPENGDLVLLRTERRLVKATFDAQTGLFLVHRPGKECIRAENVEWTYYMPAFLRMTLF